MGGGVKRTDRGVGWVEGGGGGSGGPTRACPPIVAHSLAPATQPTIREWKTRRRSAEFHEFAHPNQNPECLSSLPAQYSQPGHKIGSLRMSTVDS